MNDSLPKHPFTPIIIYKQSINNIDRIDYLHLNSILDITLQLKKRYDHIIKQLKITSIMALKVDNTNLNHSTPSFVQPPFSYFQHLMNKVNKKLQQTNVPTLIIKFKDFQKWPKILYQYFKKFSNYSTTPMDKEDSSPVVQEGYYQKQSQSSWYDSKENENNGKQEAQKVNQNTHKRPKISKQLRSQIEKFMINICQRLSLLDDYGNLFINRIRKQKQYFYPSENKSDWISTSYTPSPIDKQLQNIVTYYKYKYEYNDTAKLKINNKKEKENDVILVQLQQRIKIFYESRKRKQLYEDELKRKDEYVNYILSPNHQLQYVDRACLRCTSHFVKGTTTNIYHPSISFFSIDSYELNNYESFNNIQNNVRASMCAMLNEPAGGIILLGCEKQGRSIIPKGFYITQKEKDSLQQKLEGYFQKIYPKVKRNQQIFIHFLPIVQIKQNQDQNSSQKYISDPIPGFFVCRIYMISKQPYKIFLLKAGTDHSTLEARKSGESITIADSQHYKFLIKKFDNYFESKQKSGVINSHYNIQCIQPMVGKLGFIPSSQINTTAILSSVQTKEKDILASSSKKNNDQEEQQNIENQLSAKKSQNGNVQNKNQQTRVYLPSQLANKKHDEFKFWTLVVGDKTAIQKLKQCCNQKQKRGIKIEKLFGQNKFKLLKTTWIMFHDEKFQAMKKLAQKHNVSYKGKQIKMIASNIYLEVQGGIQNMQYNHLVSTLDYQFQTKILQIAQKQADSKNFSWLLKFQSLKGSIYAYFYLSDLNYKVKFIRGASYFTQNSKIINPSPIVGSNAPAVQSIYGSQVTDISASVNNMYNNSYGYGQYQPSYYGYGYGYQPDYYGAAAQGYYGYDVGGAAIGTNYTTPTNNNTDPNANQNQIYQMGYPNHSYPYNYYQ